MDHPQKTDIAYLSYLAAMVDGEGCVQLVSFDQKTRNRGKQFAGSVRIDNCDVRILANIKQAMTHFGIAFHVYQSSPTRNSPALTVKVQRLTMLKKLLELLLSAPLLGKRQESELLLEFVNSRLDSSGKPSGTWNPYNERAQQIVDEIRAIRTSQRAYASTHNVKVSEDVLWTATKVAEQNRNVSATQETV